MLIRIHYKAHNPIVLTDFLSYARVLVYLHVADSSLNILYKFSPSSHLLIILLQKAFVFSNNSLPTR